MLISNILLVILCIYLYRKCNRDSFTTLLNKEQFNRDVLKLKRANDIVVLFDIDKFKQINDTHGHEYGDSVIEKVATTIKKNIRMSDRAYRIGGDEFAIITNNVEVSHRIKAALTIPVSVGYGTSYKEADTNMYINKGASK